MSRTPAYADLAQLRGRAMWSFQKKDLPLANEQADAAMAMFAVLPTDHPKWLDACEGLADLMQVAGRFAECDRLCQLALAASEPNGPDRGDLEAFYANFLFAQGRLDEAETHAIAAIRAPVDEVGFVQKVLREIRAARAARPRHD